MKQLITVTVGDIHDLQGGIHLVLVNVSLVVASTMVIVLFIYVLLILTPTEKLASHVQQVIRLSMMERYHNQSLRALSCLGVTIAIFFAYTLFSSLMIRTWPQQLQLAGQRASTVYEVGADVFPLSFTQNHVMNTVLDSKTMSISSLKFTLHYSTDHHRTS
ncbi:hypothetical protein GEMRC1_005392 [Eukaryota sp. GEM-RC1]